MGGSLYITHWTFYGVDKDTVHLVVVTNVIQTTGNFLGLVLYTLYGVGVIIIHFLISHFMRTFYGHIVKMFILKENLNLPKEVTGQS